MLREVAYYTRMSRGVLKLLRAPKIADPEGIVLAQMANRERHFLETARDVIFANPNHPYCRMFQLAGCSFEDLKQGVKRDGLEPTLAALHRAGVYLSHDEFKGKKPIMRSGQTIPSSNASFINPLVSGFYQSRSGGSRSKGTITQQSLEIQLYRECYYHFMNREFGLDKRSFVGVMPILPAAWGLGQCIQAARRGKCFERWFTVGGTFRSSGHYRAATKAMVILARAMGANIPSPMYFQPNDFSRAAAWLAEKRRKGDPCWVHGLLSLCVRIAAAALEMGYDIRGTIFRVSGEALTDAKRRVIESTGAEVFPFYHIHEFGQIGQSCRQMNTGNCVHIQRDAVAVISWHRAAPLTDIEVNSLLFTSLLPFAPRVLINVEMDDAGILGPVRCDCTYQKSGFVEQVSDIYSFGKLTGQGITLIGADVVHILEEILPQRFGGAPGDYQLVEEEGSNQTQILLRISPRSGISSPEVVKEAFLGEVRRLFGGSMTFRQWQHTGAVKAVIGEPHVTGSGKVLPLHLLGPGTGYGHKS
jgi:hypothetical protein